MNKVTCQYCDNVIGESESFKDDINLLVTHYYETECSKRENGERVSSGRTLLKDIHPLSYSDTSK